MDVILELKVSLEGEEDITSKVEKLDSLQKRELCQSHKKNHKMRDTTIQLKEYFKNLFYKKPKGYDLLEKPKKDYYFKKKTEKALC